MIEKLKKIPFWRSHWAITITPLSQSKSDRHSRKVDSLKMIALSKAKVIALLKVQGIALKSQNDRTFKGLSDRT